MDATATYPIWHIWKRIGATYRDPNPQRVGNRLSATSYRTFFRYVALPGHGQRCSRAVSADLRDPEQSVRNTRVIEYLEDGEIGALLEQVDQDSRNGARDYALLLFLYNTGARAQEVVDLNIDDLRLDAPFQVKLTGKGRKERVCPLWPETVEALRTYLEHREPDTARIPSVFLNANGQPITRFGIRYIVRRYAAKAEEACPSLKSKKISPHSVRHTTAMHLLQSGNDLSIVKDWMGHADMNTTHAYVEIDMKMKRKALEATQPPEVKTFLRRSVPNGWIRASSNGSMISQSPRRLCAVLPRLPLLQAVNRHGHRSETNGTLHMTWRST